MTKKYKIVISKNGPYLVFGNLPLVKEVYNTDDQGNPGTYETGETLPSLENCALCRCGGSASKPYCDGTHVKNKFDGKETATNETYLEQAEKISGPNLDLTDVQSLCAASRFCHRGTWELTEKSDDPESKKKATETACKCSSGRLVAWDKKTNKPIETKFEPSISLLQDKASRVSGPIWVKGGIPLESESGVKYETRNRMTLCRCGKSSNKPFCDGSHLSSGFNDGDKSIN
ncbi:MAG: CDGSH iron-sulfur domain-containing protein [Candidatus Magasanikbacteria bacterium]|nr:CDGSH iron-sulfur domain-containing protein [Candidatus Magasanikbacteria bacterium]